MRALRLAPPRALLALALAGAVLAGAPRARADGGTDAAAAQVLFDQAKALMEAGKFSEACPKLAQSQKLDPGGGTLVHLGSCYEQEGKLASAWGVLREAQDVARRDRRADRELFAKKRVEALAPRLAQLTITVAPEASALGGLEVRRDGVLLDRVAWGTALPVDRGPHQISAAAPGHAPWSHTVDVPRDGVALSVAVPALDALPAQTGDGARGPAPGAGSWHKPAAIAAFSVGGAGVVLGAVFGLLARSKHVDALSLCTLGPAGNGCPQEAVDREDSARASGTLSTVAFAVGGAALVGGVIFLVTKPAASAAASAPSSLHLALTPELAAGRAGLRVGGSW